MERRSGGFERIDDPLLKQGKWRERELFLLRACRGGPAELSEGIIGRSNQLRTTLPDQIVWPVTHRATNITRDSEYFPVLIEGQRSGDHRASLFVTFDNNRCGRESAYDAVPPGKIPCIRCASHWKF